MSNKEIVKIIDFWLRSAENNQLLNRTILSDINYTSKEIVDLVGPRRSGKSSILKLIIKQLPSNKEHIYINFEDPFFIKHNSPQIIEEIITVYKEYFNPTLQYLFFDEIQEINQWEKAIRKLRDGEQYKIFLTGSSSKLLSSEISSLLTGRHLSYEISPLSFREFLAFKKINIKTKKDLILSYQKIIKQFDHYLHIGGFPEIVLTNNMELLQSYFYDIIQKDIVMRHEVREKDILANIAVYLLSNTGKIISIASLQNIFHISYTLAITYLEYFKEALLVFDLPQFSYSLKKQHKAFKKIYATDTGLVGAVSFQFSENKGRLLENIVYLELRKKFKNIYYYKTASDLEVDFLIQDHKKIKELIQVSWSLEAPETKKRELKSLIHAMNELKQTQATILTYNEEETITLDKSHTIIIQPVYKWLLTNTPSS